MGQSDGREDEDTTLDDVGMYPDAASSSRAHLPTAWADCVSLFSRQRVKAQAVESALGADSMVE